MREIPGVPGRARGVSRTTDGRDLRVRCADGQPSSLPRDKDVRVLLGCNVIEREHRTALSVGLERNLDASGQRSLPLTIGQATDASQQFPERDRGDRNISTSAAPTEPARLGSQCQHNSPERTVPSSEISPRCNMLNRQRQT